MRRNDIVAVVVSLLLFTFFGAAIGALSGKGATQMALFFLIAALTLVGTVFGGIEIGKLLDQKYGHDVAFVIIGCLVAVFVISPIILNIASLIIW